MNRLSSFLSSSGIQKNSPPRFEIWFTVIIDSHHQRALWFRYTLLIPKPESQLKPIGVVWGAYFDAALPQHHCFGIQQLSLESLSQHEGEYRWAESASFSLGHAKGTVPTSSESLSWNLKFDHLFEPFNPAPFFLRNSPALKTKSIYYSPFVKAVGDIQIGNNKIPFEGTGTLNHIWGTDRIDELYWIFVPAFDNDPEVWGIDVVFAKPKPWMPTLSFVSLRRGGEVFESQALPRFRSASKNVAFPKIDCKLSVKGYDLEIEGTLNETQLVPYLYKNPNGTDRYVVQSDVSPLTCRIQKGSEQWNLKTKNGAAIEFHGLKPWPIRQPFLSGYEKRVGK